jgi:hypothetical protein
LAAGVKKLLGQLCGVVGVAAMEQAARPGVNRDEVIRSMDDSGSRKGKHYQRGDGKHQQMQIRLGKLHGLPES